MSKAPPKRYRISITLAKDEWELLTLRCIQHGVTPSDLLRKSLLRGIGCLYRAGELCPVETGEQAPTGPANTGTGAKAPETPSERKEGADPCEIQALPQGIPPGSVGITLSEGKDGCGRDQRCPEPDEV